MDSSLDMVFCIFRIGECGRCLQQEAGTLHFNQLWTWVLFNLSDWCTRAGSQVRTLLPRTIIMINRKKSLHSYISCRSNGDLTFWCQSKHSFFLECRGCIPSSCRYKYYYSYVLVRTYQYSNGDVRLSVRPSVRNCKPRFLVVCVHTKLPDDFQEGRKGRPSSAGKFTVKINHMAILGCVSPTDRWIDGYILHK